MEIPDILNEVYIKRPSFFDSFETVVEFYKSDMNKIDAFERLRAYHFRHDGEEFDERNSDTDNQFFIDMMEPEFAEEYQECHKEFVHDSGKEQFVNSFAKYIGGGFYDEEEFEP